MLPGGPCPRATSYRLDRLRRIPEGIACRMTTFPCTDGGTVVMDRDLAQPRAAAARPQATHAVATGAILLDMNAYQWTVLFAAWLGWGFDIFDSLLFNYVAPNCVPTLLRIPIGSPAAAAATLRWTGVLTSILLVGWAV